jgi:hypothetical protein
MTDLARARIAALRLRLEIEKAGWNSDEHPRFPKHDPHGGQFAPKGGSLGSWLTNFFGRGDATQVTDYGDPFWNQYGKPQEPSYTIERKGSMLHPSPDENGKKVYIFKPSTSTPLGAPAWTDPNEILSVTPGAKTPAYLNGLALKPSPPAENWQTVAGQNPQIERGLPDLEKIRACTRPQASSFRSRMGGCG